MSLKITGKISHYPSREGVHFSFEKEQKNNEIGLNCDLPFEIWKKFRDSKVDITVTKIKE